MKMIERHGVHRPPESIAPCHYCQTPAPADEGERRLDGEWYHRECPGRWSR